MREEQNIPTVEKKTNMRRFAGFTPQQISKLLEGKGLRANTREAAEYLGAMADKAEQMLMQSQANTFYQGQGFQYGGSVGGFDDKSQKLFDAAVKRSASNQPQTPEIQRYLDNVIETRGRPTMVYPTTADPLQGYQEGGRVETRDRELGKDRIVRVTPVKRSPAEEAILQQNFTIGSEKIKKALQQAQEMERRRALQQAQQMERRDPLPTPPTTIQPIVAEVKSKLNLAQEQLSTEQSKVSALQQQLANTPIENEDARNKIIEQINQAMPQITRAEAAVANASQAFQSSAIPTAAEAVGSTVSAPADIITRQPVDQLTATTGQTIDPRTGQLTGTVTAEGTQAQTTTADAPTPMVSTQAGVTTTAQDVQAFAPQERFGTISQNAVTQAQEQATADLNIRDIQASQGTGQQIVSPAKRALNQGELVSGAANAEQSAQFLEGIEAATGAPSSAATVQGQLTNLMTQFEGGEPPPWAAGAMRQATAIMAQRGLAASSMAGQAITQAAMESALPIALQDAQTVARFEEQNLSNRQQRAMLSAQQRAQFLGMEFDQTFQARVQNASKISDIANMNFSAEQQVALENAQLAQTVDLTNLSNRQAVTMAQASSIAQADMANLSNRQQAAVQNAQNFLQMDFRNLDISQQADMFKNQSVIQSLFTDASAQNAASQFNATSENQTNQFFANLRNQVQQFNSAQSNAMNQFNAKEDNALEMFQEQINNQRDQFNAQNQLVIAQANAQWRQNLATINNAALNEANRQNALQANNLTQKGLDELWQKERDLMAYAFASAESAAGRRQELIVADMKADVSGDNAFGTALGGFASAVVGGIFNNPKYFFGA
tara:strand:+ start:187 stop:2697 length:2511 start_codon:yes stop_codon:yes gene_type:complete